MTRLVLGIGLAILACVGIVRLIELKEARSFSRVDRIMRETEDSLGR